MLLSRSITACVLLAVARTTVLPLSSEEIRVFPRKPLHDAPSGVPVVRGQVEDLRVFAAGIDDAYDEPAFTAVQPAATFLESSCGCDICQADCLESKGFLRGLWDRLGRKRQRCRRKTYFKHHRHNHHTTIYPVCPPFGAPLWGYHQTCWRRLPEPLPCPPSAVPDCPIFPLGPAPVQEHPAPPVPAEPGGTAVSQQGRPLGGAERPDASRWYPADGALRTAPEEASSLRARR